MFDEVGPSWRLIARQGLAVHFGHESWNMVKASDFTVTWAAVKHRLVKLEEIASQQWNNVKHIVWYILILFWLFVDAEKIIVWPVVAIGST